jgi:hypothetical protein
LRNFQLHWPKLILLLILFGVQHAHAKYKAKEALFLPWGDGDSELFITRPVYDPDSPTGDSLILTPAIGPDLAVVDFMDNIIFGTTANSTIQAFDKSGTQILALFFSPPYANFDDSLEVISDDSDYKSNVALDSIGAFFRLVGLSNICIDSKSQLYIESPTDQDYIAIVDLDGILIGKIYPPHFGYDVTLQDMTINSNDVLTFVDNRLYDVYTYRKGRLYQGGLEGWLAKDAYYYSAAINRETRNIDFSILGDPETPALADAFKMESHSLQTPADFCGVMGVSDDMRIFVTSNTFDEKNGQLVQIYNSNLEVIDQFRLKKNTSNKLQLTAPLPYFRPDGAMFEFQCEDDGMRIVKWSDSH